MLYSVHILLRMLLHEHPRLRPLFASHGLLQEQGDVPEYEAFVTYMFAFFIYFPWVAWESALHVA